MNAIRVHRHVHHAKFRIFLLSVLLAKYSVLDVCQGMFCRVGNVWPGVPMVNLLIPRGMVSLVQVSTRFVTVEEITPANELAIPSSRSMRFIV